MDRLLSFMSNLADRLCYGLARPPIKESCSEFLATFVLVIIGNGVIATCVLGGLKVNSVLAGAFGWGFAVMFAVLIAGGVSGGHVNPAVTVSLATVKKCEWKQVFPFVVAQYLGSFLAAAVVYLVYRDAMYLYDGGVRQLPPSLNATAQIFATYPQDFASITTCIVDQILGTALLLILVCAATDLRNLRVPPHTQPILIGLGLTGILIAFGLNCGAPLNPARDFGPRLFTAICGWGMGVFSFRNYQWFWVPIVAPHVGGVIGVWFYQALIELPFINYSKILEEMVSENCNVSQSARIAAKIINMSTASTIFTENEENYEVRRQPEQRSPETERPLLERTISSEDGTYRRLLERAATENLKAGSEDISVLSQRRSKADNV